MQAVGVRVAAAPSEALRRSVRAENARAHWRAGTAVARHWRLERSGPCARYLFETHTAAEAFAAGPGAQDDAIGRLGRPGAATHEPVPDDIIKAPIFIVSAPRSGSTMLVDALAQSDELWSIGAESTGVIEGVPALHPAACGYGSHRLTARDATQPVARAVRCGLVAELRDRYGERYLDRPSPARVRLVEKTPENALRIPFLAALFPDATFVHLIREARGAVSSIAAAWRHEGFVTIPELPGWGAWHLTLPPGWEHMRGRTRAELAAFQWAASHEAILDDLAALGARTCVVEYEALVRSPGATLRRLCTELGLRYGGPLAEYARGPLPLSATTVTPPSATKWRFNGDFAETALGPVQPLMRRLDELRSLPVPTASTRRRAGARASFSCFLEPNGELEDDAALIVEPSLRLQTGATVPLGLARRTRFKERFRPGYPIAWVEHPTSAALLPFWLRGREFSALQAPAAAEPETRAQLAGAGLLTRAETLEHERALGAAAGEAAAAMFASSDHCSLGHPLGAAHVRALRGYYRELIASGALVLGDDQVEGRYGAYNEHVARFFHHQLIAWVSRAAGEPVIPTYAYVSAYQGGAELARHVDREQCEFTVSMLIDQEPADSDAGWPLFLETAGGTVRLIQEPGEAVMFRGTRIPHYREPLAEGCSWSCLLFHYVPAGFGRILY